MDPAYPGDGSAQPDQLLPVELVGTAEVVDFKVERRPGRPNSL